MCRLWHPLIPFPATTPGKTVQMAQVLVPSTHIGDPDSVWIQHCPTVDVVASCRAEPKKGEFFVFSFSNFVI